MKITFFKMGTSPKSSELTCLHYITLQYITLRYSTLHYITVKYSTLYQTTVHCIILQYITVNYITYMHRTWCTKTYVTKGAQVLCHHGFTSGPCRTKENQTQFLISYGHLMSWDTSRGGPTHDEIGLGHAGVSFTSPKSLA